MPIDADVRKSVLTVLANNPGVPTLLNRPAAIDRDDPLQRATYLTIGQTPVYDWASYAPIENERVLTIHVWSRSSTKDKIGEINSLLTETLGDAILSSTGRALINLEFEYAGVGWDLDGACLHGLVRYRVKSTPIN